MTDRPSDADVNETVEKAVVETIEVIVDVASTARFKGFEIPVHVDESAKRAWRERYRGTYTTAVSNGRPWYGDNGDRGQVLERAQQLGRLAAFLATGVSLYKELVRAGVGREYGQNIYMQSAPLPIVDGTVAETASKWLDCVSGRQQMLWDWCTTVKNPELHEGLKELVSEIPLDA